MNKTELLADITAKGLRVIQVVQQSDPVKEAAGVNSYIANVLSQSGDTVTAKNIGFYVVDEGQAGEVAYYRDALKPKNTVWDVAQTYLDSLIPGTYLRGTLREVNEQNNSGIADVYKVDGTGTAVSKIEIFIYKNSGQPVSHYEIS